MGGDVTDGQYTGDTTPSRRVEPGDAGQGGVFEFKPDWCIAPAATLREWLDYHGLEPDTLAAACAPPEMRKQLADMLRGVLLRKPLNDWTADMLSVGTGVSAGFWRNMERHYREGLAAGLKDVTW